MVRTRVTGEIVRTISVMANLHRKSGKGPKVEEAPALKVQLVMLQFPAEDDREMLWTYTRIMGCEMLLEKP